MTKQEREELVEALGLGGEGQTVAVFDVKESNAEPDAAALHMLLVEGPRLIVVSHGWGASGAHVDVRTYVGTDDPQQVTPEVLELDRTVSIYNSFR